jgi:hypothetical protein
MTDKQFLKILTAAYKAIGTEYGVKVCRETVLSCTNCQAQIVRGGLGDMIDTIKWAMKK